ncbi:hypothetical protein RRG08_019993 [Elysia crispata]|uniref:Uncharacterized protein n=1 Tax=Elysia crispata TaxID=231223 RepID=A0AAE1EDG8_9GAST|nr:hypothetical protein RRG08_019993 [Elysia crispata]
MFYKLETAPIYDREDKCSTNWRQHQSTTGRINVLQTGDSTNLRQGGYMFYKLETAPTCDREDKCSTNWRQHQSTTGRINVLQTGDSTNLRQGG